LDLVQDWHNQTKNKRGARTRGGFQTLPVLTDPQMNSELNVGHPASPGGNPEKPKSSARIP